MLLVGALTGQCSLSNGLEPDPQKKNAKGRESREHVGNQGLATWWPNRVQEILKEKSSISCAVGLKRAISLVMSNEIIILLVCQSE